MQELDPHHHARLAVRRRFPDAEIVLSSGGSLYMVRAGDRLLSRPQATITRAWMEARKVVNEMPEPAARQAGAPDNG